MLDYLRINLIKKRMCTNKQKFLLFEVDIKTLRTKEFCHVTENFRGKFESDFYIYFSLN